MVTLTNCKPCCTRRVRHWIQQNVSAETSAAATGIQQPCDLSPVFRLLRQLQKITTARDDNACGLAEDIDDLFGKHLGEKGLNLDGNRPKKRALIDFLLSVPEALETV